MQEPSIHFRKGIEAGIHGLLEESAQSFAQGHEQGDVECSAELAICYREGVGVPRDFNEFYRLARELEQKDCPFKSLMVKERANAFVMLCPDADPALCFLK